MGMEGKIIAVVSPKGGIGKTTVSLVVPYLFDITDYMYADCDIYNPSLSTVLDAKAKKTVKVEWKVYRIDRSKCKKCLRCVYRCLKNAICIDIEGYPFIAEDLCEGCGLCYSSCPAGAIYSVDIHLGDVFIDDEKKIVWGSVKEKYSDKASIVVRRIVKEALKLKEKEDITLIIDSPAGIHCDSASVLYYADVVIIVTATGELGRRILSRAAELINSFDIKEKFVVYNFCAEKPSAEDIEFSVNLGLKPLAWIHDSNRAASFDPKKIIREVELFKE